MYINLRHNLIKQNLYKSFFIKDQFFNIADGLNLKLNTEYFYLITNPDGPKLNYLHDFFIDKFSDNDEVCWLNCQTENLKKIKLHHLYKIYEKVNFSDSKETEALKNFKKQLKKTERNYQNIKKLSFDKVYLLDDKYELNLKKLYEKVHSDNFLFMKKQKILNQISKLKKTNFDLKLKFKDDIANLNAKDLKLNIETNLAYKFNELNNKYQIIIKKINYFKQLESLEQQQKNPNNQSNQPPTISSFSANLDKLKFIDLNIEIKKINQEIRAINLKNNTFHLTQLGNMVNFEFFENEIKKLGEELDNHKIKNDLIKNFLLFIKNQSNESDIINQKAFLSFLNYMYGVIENHFLIIDQKLASIRQTLETITQNRHGNLQPQEVNSLNLLRSIFLYERSYFNEVTFLLFNFKKEFTNLIICHRTENRQQIYQKAKLWIKKLQKLFNANLIWEAKHNKTVVEQQIVFFKKAYLEKINKNKLAIRFLNSEKHKLDLTEENKKIQSIYDSEIEFIKESLITKFKENPELLKELKLQLKNKINLLSQKISKLERQNYIDNVIKEFNDKFNNFLKLFNLDFREDVINPKLFNLKIYVIEQIIYKKQFLLIKNLDTLSLEDQKNFCDFLKNIHDNKLLTPIIFTTLLTNYKNYGQYVLVYFNGKIIERAPFNELITNPQKTFTKNYLAELKLINSEKILNFSKRIIFNDENKFYYSNELIFQEKLLTNEHYYLTWKTEKGA